MARLPQTFYQDQLPRSADIAFDPVPEGIYKVQVDDADFKTSTSKATSQYIWMELSVVKHPEYTGRKLFANITVSNESQKAVDIGRAQLGDLLEVTGISSFNDTDVLKGKIFSVKVKVQDGTKDRPNKTNNVTAYLYEDGHAPGKGPLPAGGAPVSAAAPADAPKAPPKRPF